MASRSSLPASRLLALVLGLAVAAGCAPGEGPEPRAAEPAVAPTPTVPPTGDVSPVGDQPEGIVADGVTGIVAVGLRSPNRLALLDAETLETLTEVPLPGHVRHLQLAGPGGPVLVAAEDSDTYLSVSLPDGEVTEQLVVGTYPHDATQALDGSVWVADELGGTISVVRDGEVVETFDQATQPGGVAAAGGRVVVLDVRLSTVSAYTTDPTEFVVTLPVGDGITHAVTDKRDRVVVADTRGGALYVLGLEPRLEVLQSAPLPGRPYGLAYDPERDRLWVTLTETNEVVEVALDGAQPQVLRRFPTVHQPNTVAVDPATGRVYVASRRADTLQVIEP